MQAKLGKPGYGVRPERERAPCGSFGGYPRWMARSLVIAAAPSSGVTQEIQLICTEAEFGFSIPCDHFLLFE